MRTSDWIKNKAKELGGDIESLKSEDVYLEFVGETGSTAEYASYLRRIRENINNGNIVADAETASATSEDSGFWDKETLIEILTEEVKQHEKKISLGELKEIAKERNIPFSAFLEKIPNLRELITEVYEYNVYYLSDKRKINELTEEIKQLKKENRQLLKETSLENRVTGIISNAVRAYEPLKDDGAFYTSFRGDRTAHLLVSDVHFDELVQLEEMHGINEYSPFVAKQRIDKLFQELLLYTEELKIKDLWIKLLGDMVSGMIHEELMMHAELGITQAVLQLAEYLSQWIAEIRPRFERIEVLGLGGNHGRMTKKPMFKGRQSMSYDVMVYHFMEIHLRDIVDSFDIPVAPFAVRDCRGVSIFSTHGDTLKGGTGLNPVSGTWGRDLAKLSAGFKRHNLGFDIAEFGHFHEGDMNLKGFDETKIIPNGSVVGANEFSIGAVKRASRPNQSVYMIEDGKGFGHMHTIYLD